MRATGGRAMLLKVPVVLMVLVDPVHLCVDIATRDTFLTAT
jgi:hypothetical protein